MKDIADFEEYIANFDKEEEKCNMTRKKNKIWKTKRTRDDCKNYEEIGCVWRRLYDDDKKEECHYSGHLEDREKYGENMNLYLKTDSKKRKNAILNPWDMSQGEKEFIENADYLDAIHGGGALRKSKRSKSKRSKSKS